MSWWSACYRKGLVDELQIRGEPAGVWDGHSPIRGFRRKVHFNLTRTLLLQYGAVMLTYKPVQ